MKKKVEKIDAKTENILYKGYVKQLKKENDMLRKMLLDLQKRELQVKEEAFNEIEELKGELWLAKCKR
jgi:hypothetical protein